MKFLMDVGPQTKSHSDIKVKCIMLFKRELKKGLIFPKAIRRANVL